MLCIYNFLWTHSFSMIRIIINLLLLMTILNGAAYLGCLKSLETWISVASLHDITMHARLLLAMKEIAWPKLHEFASCVVIIWFRFFHFADTQNWIPPLLLKQGWHYYQMPDPFLYLIFYWYKWKYWSQRRNIFVWLKFHQFAWIYPCWDHWQVMVPFPSCLRPGYSISLS